MFACFDKTENSFFNGLSKSSKAKWLLSIFSELLSKREISTKSDNNASTTLSESSMFSASAVNSSPCTLFFNIDVNKDKALNGCIKS